MLKALEIVGFKSFADRTRFEFPPGITVVVGPNGSGKSNIVDAIKWVLGEQSVKSLRGREMADVIFNGSGSRRALNAAEITLTFDNSKHLLAIDAPEVGITRRVYRSGEGEYLINRNPARLRDIRDLLSGTGMGTQAYSVIEQGKVDSLLQSSPHDRRVIFEEAAGISRFKMRKVESLRRLERVEQNLLRLSDIVDEVENRLRGVRNQAGKARRYKEFADRLQELRTQVGQVDWRRLTQRLTEFEKELQAVADERGAATAEGEAVEAKLLAADNAIAEVTEEIRQAEAEIAGNRERIAAAESTIEHERTRSADLDDEIARCRQQLVALSARAGDLQEQQRETTEAFAAEQANHSDVTSRLAETRQSLAAAAVELESLRGEREQRRAEHLQQMRLAATLGNETASLESQLAAATEAGQRCGNRMAELDRGLNALQSQLQTLRERRADAERRTEQHAESLIAAKDQLAQVQRRHAVRRNELSELRQRQSGAAERAAVLDELVRRHEGIGAGVKEVLQRANNATDPVFRNVRGLVADLLHVSVEAAPLVEIALGPAAQHVVAAPTAELLNHLQREANRLGGRVGFVWLSEPAAHQAVGWVKQTEAHGGASVAATGHIEAMDAASQLIGLRSPTKNSRDLDPPHNDLEGQPGVLGRADGFVEAAAPMDAVAKRLLGRTWFVENLTHAFALARSLGPQYSYVTLAGDLLEPDGTLTVGPRNVATGLISRRSELRALQTQLADLLASIEAAQADVAKLDEQIDAQQRSVDRLATEHQQAVHAMAENRVAISAAEERRAQFDEQRTALDSELQKAKAQHDAATVRLTESEEQRRQTDARVAETERELATLNEQIESIETRRAAAERTSTEVQVQLAKSEERLRNLEAQMKQCEESREERSRAIEEAREHLADAAARAEATKRAILTAETETAELYLRKETFASQCVALMERRETIQADRTGLAGEAQRINARLRKLEDKAHATELAAHDVRIERTSMVERLRDDYGIDPAELERTATDEEQQARDAAQAEIEELRKKLNGLGNVNLESLEELDELESRFKTLSDQRQDLTSAKASLEKIIEKINADSRRLFSETLETVRGHFQSLFRDLFGGGQADIILEENVDILDSGIEIVARPPGKEPRSISLLSGGEKTMTCVALLLAIFRSRPSPFCVLDEVDAALDEANIDRFTQVLKDFLAWTQFIIVTHSKKTMTCADTIYGVTMQESGVTKQVSVRFEDVSDDGHILTERPVEKAA